MSASPFARMTPDQLLAHCRQLYEAHGPEALLYNKLKRAKGLYCALYDAGLRQRVLLERLGIPADAFKEATAASRDRVSSNGKLRKGWNRERILDLAKKVLIEQGHLPPAGWFQANGHGSMVQAMYYDGMRWGDLRDALDLPSSEVGGMVKSRNGMWWRSHSEACVSNYLHARGIPHRRGDDYPPAYVAMSGRRSGQYDVAFQGTDGGWFNMEIWGDKPYGHDQEGYARKRRTKEIFNKGNLRFLGVHYSDCWSDSKLDRLLGKIIGGDHPITYELSHDHLIQTVHWSDADELIAFCRTLAAQQPGGDFPAEDWLRKRGRHSERAGPTYNTLSIYIKTLIGGIRRLRVILGQSQVSTQQWSRERALAELRAWVDRFGMPPRTTVELAARRGHVVDEQTILHGQNIDAAVLKYAGGLVQAYRELGLSVARAPRLKRQRMDEEINPQSPDPVAG